MNGYAILAGAMLICFADREVFSAEFKGGTKISFRYPFIGAILIVAGLWLL